MEDLSHESGKKGRYKRTKEIKKLLCKSIQSESVKIVELQFCKNKTQPWVNIKMNSQENADELLRLGKKDILVNNETKNITFNPVPGAAVPPPPPIDENNATSVTPPPPRVDVNNETTVTTPSRVVPTPLRADANNETTVPTPPRADANNENGTRVHSRPSSSESRRKRYKVQFDQVLDAMEGVEAEGDDEGEETKIDIPLEAADEEIADNDDDVQIEIEQSIENVIGGDVTERDDSNDSSDNSDSEIISCESTSSNSSKDSWDASTLQEMFHKHSINDASGGSPLRANIENQHRAFDEGDRTKSVGATIMVTPSPSAAPVTPSPSAAPVTPSPSAAPVTPSPSAAPVTTFKPTSSAPTNSPSQSPISSPTVPPTPSPTEAPTPSPSMKPTINPSSSPTPSPRQSPTAAPVTLTPTSSPITSVPTSSPDGPYYIRNPSTGKLLSIDGGICDDGTNIVLLQDDKEVWQQWTINHDNTFESVHCPGMVVGFAGTQCGNLVSVILTSKGSDGQTWTLQDGVM
eukprot:scaffold20651_cov42-Cyclotella_meneghiniana.AAC.6